MPALGRNLTMASPPTPPTAKHLIDLIHDAGWLAAIGSLSGAFVLLVKALFVERYKVKADAEHAKEVAEHVEEQDRAAQRMEADDKTFQRLTTDNERLQHRVDSLESRLGALEERYAMQVATKDKIIEEKNVLIAHLEADLESQRLINDGLVRQVDKLESLMRTHGIQVG